MEIGYKIKQLRVEKGVTQEALAEYLKISSQAVSKWETNASTPDISLLPAISVFFGVTIDDLFTISDETQYDRIQEMYYNERRISDESFLATKRFLTEQIAKDDKNVKAYRMLANLYNHRAHSDHEEASAYAKKALAIDSKDPESWGQFNEANAAVSGDEWVDNHSGVIEFYREMLNAEPDNLPALMFIIENLLADRRMDEAVPYIKKIGEVAPKLQKEKMFLGDVAFLKGNLEEAEAFWNAGVTEHPERWQAYCDRADRLKKIGKLKEAIEDYEYCVSMQQAPRVTDGLYSLTQIHEAMGNIDAAIHDWERILTIVREEYGVTGGEEIEEPLREMERLRKKK